MTYFSKSFLTKTRVSNQQGSAITNLKTLALLALSILVSTVTAGGGDLPANWWLQAKARPIHSYSEYLDLLKGEFKDKTIFIDFYMQHCPWCYYILDDFNQLIDDMTRWYGPEQVVFLKVDGTKIKQLANRYKVNSYPKFIAIAPNKEGNVYDIFGGASRNYENMKKWMIGLMPSSPKKVTTPVVQEDTTRTAPKPTVVSQAPVNPTYQVTPPVQPQPAVIESPRVVNEAPGGYSAQQNNMDIHDAYYQDGFGDDDDDLENDLDSRIHGHDLEVESSVKANPAPRMNQQKEQLSQQQARTNTNSQVNNNQAYLDELRQVKEQSEKQRQKIDTLTRKLDDAIGTISTQKTQMSQQNEQILLAQKMKQEPPTEEPTEQPAPSSDIGMSPMTYMLIGITIGSIASVILVAYMNKQAALAKLAKRKLRGKGPSSGSPLTSLDEEKSA